jgi:hypothetical protein
MRCGTSEVKYCPAHELLGAQVSKWQTLERHQYWAGLRLQNAVELSIIGIGARSGFEISDRRLRDARKLFQPQDLQLGFDEESRYPLRSPGKSNLSGRHD